MMKRYCLLMILMVIGQVGFSNFRIVGTVKQSGISHFTEVQLSLLNHPLDFFITSPDFIIQQANINSDGTFSIVGDDLPTEKCFYQLTFRSALSNRETNSKSLYLFIDNDSQLRVNTLLMQGEFEDVQIEGSPESSRLLDFVKTIKKKRIKLSMARSKNKRLLMQQSIDRYIKNFISSNENSLLGLFALYHIENRENDFLNSSDFYIDFQSRLQKQYPESRYTLALSDHIKDMINFRNTVCQIPDSQKNYLSTIIWILSFIVFALTVTVVVLFQKLRCLTHSQKQDIDLTALTSKERQILELIADSKSNKEVASEMHVELSTIKTHVNNLFKKLNVSNRNEAANLYRRILK